MSQLYGVRAPTPLPDATHVGGVRLQVSDLARSLTFYSEGLGLRVMEQAEDHATLAPHQSTVPLVTLHTHVGVQPRPRSGRLGLYHFAILVPDRATLGLLMLHLHQSGVPLASADHAVSEALYLHDPDGLGIELYVDRPRSQWRHNKTELYMTTDPLDHTSLARAADGLQWSGMPQGTRMGHVHLHVHDTEAAKQFYHNVLGLDLMVWSYPGALFLSAGGYHHHVGLNTWAGPNAVVPERDEAQLLEWQLMVPSAVATSEIHSRVLSAGLSTESHADGTWTVRDPSGSLLHVTHG